MEIVGQSGRHYITLDGPGLAAVPVRKSRLVDPVYPPGKRAAESDIKKSKASNATSPTPHAVGDDAIPEIKFHAVYNFTGPDGMLRHGVVVGQSASHVLLATRDGRFTAPKAKLSPGLHHGAERG